MKSQSLEQPQWPDDASLMNTEAAPTEVSASASSADAFVGEGLVLPAKLPDQDPDDQIAPELDTYQDSSSDEMEEPDLQATEDGAAPVEKKKKKLGFKLALGVAAVAALIAAPHAIEAKDAVVDNLAWALPVLTVSEVAWNSGAALMLLAAGKKIGNPLKLHSRFKEVSHDFVNVVDKPIFKVGMVTNILGEVGTASILIGGSIAELPPATWPLTMGTSVLLAAPAAVAWTALWRSKHKKG